MASGRRLPAILAVDAGASKVDVALIDRNGAVLGAARRMGRSNVGISLESGSMVIDDAIGTAARQAGVGTAPAAALGVYCLAGADFPADDRRIARAFARRGWTERTEVRNDTFAVLRAGTRTGWGVAVACGTGMNCVGLGPDGRTVRFPALGEVSGDWAAGGEWIGWRALGSAVRARDRRGPRTILERAVPRCLGLASPGAVVQAIHRRRMSRTRLLELSPVVFEAARQGDAVARGILDIQADEVVAWAVAALRRLHLTAMVTEVILGGGIFRPDDQVFLDRIRDGVAASAPQAVVRKLEAPPVVGAALLGLDDIGASARAAARLKASLSYRRLDGAQPDPGAGGIGGPGGAR